MAMNLHSAVTKVTNIPTSLLLSPGSCSVYRMSRQFGGGRGVESQGSSQTGHMAVSAEKN